MGVISVSQPEYRDPLTKVVHGLQIAQGIMGIKSDIEQSRLRALQESKARQDLEEQQAMDSGIFTEGLYNKQYRVPEGTEGSSEAWVDKPQRDEEGNLLYDVKTGKPITEREKFSYVPMNSAQIQSLINKQAMADMEMKRQQSVMRGEVTPDMILQGKVSLAPKGDKNAFPGTLIKPDGTKETAYFIPGKRELKEERINSQGAAGQVAARGNPFKPTDEKFYDYNAAVAAGIKSPTPKDLTDYSPKETDIRFQNYNKAITNEMVELADALTNADNTFGISFSRISKDKIVPQKVVQIPGVTDGTWVAQDSTIYQRASDALRNARAFTIPGYLDKYREQQRNRGIIYGIQNSILKARSGGAVTDGEAGRLLEELNLSLGKRDPTLVRDKLNDIRRVLYNKVLKAEASTISGQKGATDMIIKQRNSILSPYSPLFKSHRPESATRRMEEPMTNEEAADAVINDEY